MDEQSGRRRNTCLSFFKVVNNPSLNYDGLPIDNIITYCYQILQCRKTYAVWGRWTTLQSGEQLVKCGLSTQKIRARSSTYSVLCLGTRVIVAASNWFNNGSKIKEFILITFSERLTPYHSRVSQTVVYSRCNRACLILVILKTRRQLTFVWLC